MLAKLHNNIIQAKTMPLPFCDFDSFFFVFCHPATQTYLCHELKSIEYMSVTVNTQLGELMFSTQIIYTWRRLRHQSKLYGVRLAQVFPTSTSRRATTTRPSCRSSRAGPRAFRNSPQNSTSTLRRLLKACDSTRIKSRLPESTASSA